MRYIFFQWKINSDRQISEFFVEVKLIFGFSFIYIIQETVPTSAIQRTHQVDQDTMPATLEQEHVLIRTIMLIKATQTIQPIDHLVNKR